MAKQLDAALRKGLEKTPDLLSEYDSAVAHYKQGITEFKNELVTKVVESLGQSPGKLESVLLQPNNQDTIAAVKTAVGPMWEQQIAPKLRSILLMNARQADGAFSGAQLEKQIIDLIGPNPARNNTMTTIFGEPATKELLGLAKALQLTEAPGARAWWVKLRQASVIGAIAGAGIGTATGYATDSPTAGVGTGAMVLLTPWALGHLTANPALLKAFKDGIIQSSQQKQISKGLDLALTSLRQLAGAMAAPTGRGEQTFTKDEMRAPLAGRNVETMLPRQPQTSFTEER